MPTSKTSLMARKGGVANLIGLSLVPILLGTYGAGAFVVPPSASQAATTTSGSVVSPSSPALSLVPSQASELVEAACVQAYPPSPEMDDDSIESVEDMDDSIMKADASWLWDVDVEAPAASRSHSDEGAAAKAGTHRGLVARVFALPSSLIKRNRDPHIAVTKDDVVLFPVVGCRLVPEYSYGHEDAIEPDSTKIAKKTKKKSTSAAAAPAVHVRSLPTVSNPSCRIRNFRDEEVVGWYRQHHTVD